LDNAIGGDNYGAYEMTFDGFSGGVLSRFPGASALEPRPGWMTHSFAAYAGAHTGVISESTKFVIGEVVKGGMGFVPW
jgi:hypothetical protein